MNDVFIPTYPKSSSIFDTIGKIINSKKNFRTRVFKGISAPTLVEHFFLKYDYKQIAECFTLREFQTFSYLNKEEFFKLNWTKEDKEKLAANIVLLTSDFNRFSNFIIFEILSCSELSARVKTLHYVLKVGLQFMRLNNFSSLMSLFSAVRKQKFTFSFCFLNVQKKSFQAPLSTDFRRHGLGCQRKTKKFTKSWPVWFLQTTISLT